MCHPQIAVSRPVLARPRTVAVLGTPFRCGDMGAPRPTLTSTATPALSQPVEKGRPLMVAQEPGLPARAQVVGALTGAAVELLLAAVDRGVAVLDMSQVDSADEPAVRALAGLLPRRCSLVACPRWLELWLGRVRWPSGSERRAA